MSLEDIVKRIPTVAKETEFPPNGMVNRVLRLVAEARDSGYIKRGDEYLHMASADYVALRDEAITYSTSFATSTEALPLGIPGPYPSPSMYFAGVPVYPDPAVRVTYVGCRGSMIATLDLEAS